MWGLGESGEGDARTHPFAREGRRTSTPRPAIGIVDRAGNSGRKTGTGAGDSPAGGPAGRKSARAADAGGAGRRCPDRAVAAGSDSRTGRRTAGEGERTPDAGPDGGRDGAPHARSGRAAAPAGAVGRVGSGSSGQAGSDLRRLGRARPGMAAGRVTAAAHPPDRPRPGRRRSSRPGPMAKPSSARLDRESPPPGGIAPGPAHPPRAGGPARTGRGRCRARSGPAGPPAEWSRSRLGQTVLQVEGGGRPSCPSRRGSARRSRPLPVRSRMFSPGTPTPATEVRR